MSRQTTVFEYVPFLLSLSASGQNYFIEGGQAVNFWAEYYTALGVGSDLEKLKPFTSEDCDLWVSHAAWNYLKIKEKPHLICSNSPIDGQLGILTLGTESNLVIDLLANVYGFSTRDPKVHIGLMRRAPNVRGIFILDPVCLFRSKAACWHGLDQSGRQDEKHFRILATLLPAYLAEMLSLVREIPQNDHEICERKMILELKLLLKYCQFPDVKSALKKTNTEVFDLLPIDLMADSKLPKILKFLSSLPK